MTVGFFFPFYIFIVIGQFESLGRGLLLLHVCTSLCLSLSENIQNLDNKNTVKI